MKRDRVVFKLPGVHIEGEGKPAMTIAYLGAAILLAAVVTSMFASGLISYVYRLFL